MTEAFDLSQTEFYSPIKCNFHSPHNVHFLPFSLFSFYSVTAK